MCDKHGNVWSEGGNIIGRAELVPESERAGEKEGPFAGFSSPTVTKDGKIGMWNFLLVFHTKHYFVLGVDTIITRSSSLLFP